MNPILFLCTFCAAAETLFSGVLLFTNPADQTLTMFGGSGALLIICLILNLITRKA